MSNLNYLQWPFFEARHGDLAQALETWSKTNLGGPHIQDVDTECRNLVRALGQENWLRYAVAGQLYGGAQKTIDTRSICLIWRDQLGRHRDAKKNVSSACLRWRGNCGLCTERIRRWL